MSESVDLKISGSVRIEVRPDAAEMQGYLYLGEENGVEVRTEDEWRRDGKQLVRRRIITTGWKEVENG